MAIIKNQNIEGSYKSTTGKYTVEMWESSGKYTVNVVDKNRFIHSNNRYYEGNDLTEASKKYKEVIQLITM